MSVQGMRHLRQEFQQSAHLVVHCVTFSPSECVVEVKMNSCKVFYHITMILPYSLALQPFESLGLLNYNAPSSLSTPSCNILCLSSPMILFSIFHPSHCKFSLSSSSLPFTLKYFLKYPYMILPYQMSYPFQFPIFMSTAMSKSLFSSCSY